MRRLMMWVVAVGVTAGMLVSCGAPAPTTPPPAKKATTATPVTK